MQKSCLDCALFSSCTNKNRRYDFVCVKHKPKIIRDLDFKSFNKDKPIESFKYDPSKDDDFNIFEFIEEMTKHDKPLSRDIRIDDRDIPQAPNFFEFCVDPRYLNVTPFPKQIEVIANYFNEICWKCSNKSWKKEFPTSCTYEDIRENIQFFEYGVCPCCGRRKSTQINKGRLKAYVQLAGLVGQRGGKSATYCMGEAYRLHWCVKTHKLAQFYGLLPSSQLHSTYTAITLGQAKETIFDNLTDYLRTSPWWKSWCECADYYSNKFGEELYSIKETFYKFRHISLTGYPATPDKRSLRGKTRVSGAIDEIGWFLAAQEGTIKFDSDEIHKAMLNSFKTIQNATRRLYEEGVDNVLNPFFGCISSPSSVNDKIMRLYEESKTSSTIYGFRYSTWEFNPTYTKKDFEDEEKNHPKEFLRDYCTIPPLSSNPFIEELSQIKPCIGSNQNAFKLFVDRVKTNAGRTMSSARLQKTWESKANRILALDAGLNNNSFALCLAHNEKGSDGTLRPVYDCIAEVIPEKNCPINFTYMYENVILPICKDYGVVMAVADRWNSAKVLDDLESAIKGLEVETYSVKYEDFNTFKEMTFNSQYTIPKNEIKLKNITTNIKDYPACMDLTPIAHFLLQCITVQDYGAKTVSKGDGYTDDMFRAVVLANSYLVDKNYKNKFIGEANQRHSSGVIGSRGDGSGGLCNVAARPSGMGTSNMFGSRGNG